MQELDTKRVIAALYQFKSLDNLEERKKELLAFCKKNDILGTLILGEEGVNGTIIGSREGIDNVVAFLAAWGFNNLEYKESHPPKDALVFYRMKVKVKKEICTMRVEGLQPNEHRAHYLSPREWHELIKNPDVIILDTRNDYEYHIGTFKNAINPQTIAFKDFPAFCEMHRDEWKDKTIAMFCTGGIRCEKSTSFATTTNLGKEVFHLKGGILKYLEEIPAEEGLWEGECFVFDYRVSVGYDLVPGNYKLCYTCRMPLTPEETQSEHYMHGYQCPYCYDKLTPKQRERFAMRSQQMEQGYCTFAPKIS